MVKDNNVNIKLEVCRDKASGKLYIRAHFDSKAPNVFKDKDFYTWMPTIEEQNLINDAFEFMPIVSSPSIKEMKKPEIEEKKDETKTSKSSTDTDTDFKPEIKIQENKQEIKEPQKIEKPQGSDVFQVTNENTPKNDEKDNFTIEENTSENSFEKINEPTEEEPEKEQSISSKIEEDDRIIVEADSDAIEAALEKHMGSKDKSIVEADEKTIIDRVLKQKKKGKWRE